MGLSARRYDFFLQSPLLGATRLEAEFDWGGTHIWVSTCVVEVCPALLPTPRRDSASEFRATLYLQSPMRSLLSGPW